MRTISPSWPWRGSRGMRWVPSTRDQVTDEERASRRSVPARAERTPYLAAARDESQNGRPLLAQRTACLSNRHFAPVIDSLLVFTARGAAFDLPSSDWP